MAQLPIVPVKPGFVANRTANIFILRAIRAFVKRGNRQIRATTIARRPQGFELLSGDIVVILCDTQMPPAGALIGVRGVHVIADPRYTDYQYNLANYRMVLKLVNDVADFKFAYAYMHPMSGVYYDVFVKKNDQDNPVSQGTSGTKATPMWRFAYIPAPNEMFNSIEIVGLEAIPGRRVNADGWVAMIPFEVETVNNRTVKTWKQPYFMKADVFVQVNTQVILSKLKKSTPRFNKPVARIIRTRQRMARRVIQRRIRMFVTQVRRMYMQYLRQMAARQRQMMQIARQVGLRRMQLMRAFQRQARFAYLHARPGWRVAMPVFGRMTFAGSPQQIRRQLLSEMGRMGRAVGSSTGQAQALGEQIRALLTRINALEKRIDELVKKLENSPKDANDRTNANITKTKKTGGSGSGSDGTTRKAECKLTKIRCVGVNHVLGLFVGIVEVNINDFNEHMPDKTITINFGNTIGEVTEKLPTLETVRNKTYALYFVKKVNLPSHANQHSRYAGEVLQARITKQSNKVYNFVMEDPNWRLLDISGPDVSLKGFNLLYEVRHSASIRAGHRVGLIRLSWVHNVKPPKTYDEAKQAFKIKVGGQVYSPITVVSMRYDRGPNRAEFIFTISEEAWNGLCSDDDAVYVILTNPTKHFQRTTNNEILPQYANTPIMSRYMDYPY